MEDKDFIISRVDSFVKEVDSFIDDVGKHDVCLSISDKLTLAVTSVCFKGLLLGFKSKLCSDNDVEKSEDSK